MSIKQLISYLSGIGILLLAGCGGDAGTSDSGPAGTAAAGEVNFQPEFPPEQIDGTPEEGEIANVEAVPSRPPSLRLPEGATLISEGKPLTASDDFPIIGELAYVTDGSMNAGEGYYVELMPGEQWVQIDLDSEHSVHGLWLWHYHRQERVYNSVVVQLSNDETFESGVTTVFNNDYENALGFGKGRDRPYFESRYGKPISVDGVDARFVRLYSAGNTANEMNHYIEVQVFGAPATGGS